MVSQHQAALKERLDRLNFLWDVFHDELRDLNRPVNAVYVYDRNPNDEEEYFVLGFGKINGKWCIYTAGHFFDQERDDYVRMDVKPISECSAALRVELVKYVPSLRKEVEATFAKFLDRTDNAIADLESQLDLSGYIEEKFA
jgi:hypothetical protein